MALQDTTKIRLFFSSKKEKEVLSFLQEKGVMEIVSVDGEMREGGCGHVESGMAKIDFAIRYLSAYAPEKKGLRNIVLGEKLEISEDEAREKALLCDWKGVVKKVSELESEKNDIERELSESRIVLSELENFDEVDVESSEGVYSTSFFVLPIRSASKFLREVREVSKYLEIFEVRKTGSFVSFVLFSRESEKNEVLTILSRRKGSEVFFEKGLTPVQKISELRNRIVSLEKKKEENFSLSQFLAKEIDSLKMCYDELSSQKEMIVALRKVKDGGFVSVAEGWIPSRQFSSLKDSLFDEFVEIEVEEIEKSEKEIKRVILKPSSFMAPIMEITKMFGVPRSEEVDPTPYYAVFFLVFFGFCLTDAGYGMILVFVTSLILALKLPLERSIANMIKMFLYGGVATIVMGALFGGWFGLTPDQVPEFLTYVNNDGKRMFLGQIFDPMVDLVGEIMPLTYLLGVIHLSLGLYLSGLISWRAGDKSRMLFVSVPMMLMFVFAFLSWGVGISFFVYPFYIVTLLSMWGLGKSGNPFVRMLKGVGALLSESLGWFSNILSYSRLFALGLATGIIAMSFNVVAVTMGGMVSGVGGAIVMFIVLAFGHTLNIALNVLGAYVHSSRLQFVEFFGMFLEGGGVVLSPLRKVCRFRHTS